MNKTSVNISILLAIPALLSACQPKIYSQEEITETCTEERLDAEGVRGGVTVGANSVTGPQVGVSLRISDSYIRGLDPQSVYDQCVQKLNNHNVRASEAQ